jgi:carbamoyltransferase
LAGGCALNIKWNRSLRESGLARELFVPPFPNDAGSAIGMIACDLFREGGGPLAWSSYLGASLGPELPLAPEWVGKPCGLEQLAALMLNTGDPVVFLAGRAELGPRALGHRSILADPRNVAMRDRLNAIKGREPFRPVAPICIEHRARQIFSPGKRDPFMLFEHRVRDGWAERIPAVIHLDGTARLQTISESDEPQLFELLTHWERISGVPVLCNTSANNSGCGFFPDAASAARWGGCRFIWVEGQLFVRSDRMR